MRPPDPAPCRRLRVAALPAVDLPTRGHVCANCGSRCSPSVSSARRGPRAGKFSRPTAGRALTTCCRVAPTRDGPGLPLTHNPGPDTSRRRNGLVLQADRPYRGWFRVGFVWRNTWSEPHGAEVLT